MKNLLEKLKGERTPEESLAAQPKASCGCSCSGDVAILSLSLSQLFCFTNDVVGLSLKSE